MAIKKTANMSAAPKKVVAKKPDPGKGFGSQISQNIKKGASKMSTVTQRGIEYNVFNQPYQEKPSKNKGERYFETPDGRFKLTLKGFPEQKKKKKS